ncbi:MAG: polysaccharide deacetylase family protein [Patescibacteria group bacterium]|nr:polysaccharide deacetylase family protein [Patescibacteria group bacterium]
MFNFFYKPKKIINRYVSFTFDDGLINSANKVNDIIYPNKAIFYIVTGWLKPNPIKINDKCNIGLDHGDFEQWKKLSNLGHEISSHTVCHAGPSSDGPDGYIESLKYIQQFHPGPYSLAMPYGIKSPDNPPYDSIRLCDGKYIYNSLEKIDLLELISFDPFEGRLTIEKALKKISQLPANSWLILRAHGLDNEGYCPWPSEYLKKIYELLLIENFEIKTIREMTLEVKNNLRLVKNH